MSTETRWFIAEAIFQATIRNRGEDWEPLVERLFFLVSDVDEESATVKAERIAKEKKHSYENANGELVTWKFMQLIEVSEMIDQILQDGSELKSWMTGGETKVGAIPKVS